MDIQEYTYNNTVIYNGDCFDVMKQFDTGVAKYRKTNANGLSTD